MRNSFFWQAMLQAWELVSDHPLPRLFRGGRSNVPEPYAVCLLPCWGAAAAPAAFLFGKLLNVFFPAEGSALIFASAMLFCSEWRTSFRALALTVSTADALAGGASWSAAAVRRTADIRKLSGVVPTLATVVLLILKFSAFAQCFRHGDAWFAGIALTAALTAEGFLAVQPDASGGAGLLSGGRTPEAVLLVGGFILLWSLVLLPVPTLAGLGAAAAAGFLIFRAALSRRGKLVSDDITFAGYSVELLMLAAARIFL